MATRRPAASSKVPATAVSVPAAASATSASLKLRQTQAEYVAARPSGEPGVKPMMSSSKMYVCRRCQANFKTGDGKPDSRLPGLGKCNKCLAAQAASALAA
jgi:predicted RNA-binding Zn ribbon-like protein